VRAFGHFTGGDVVKAPLRAFSDQIYSIARAVVGFLFWQHGAQKLFAMFGQDERVELFSQMGLAGIVEFFGGALIMLGLFTPWASFVASGEMAFAYFLNHFPDGGSPIENSGERAVFYCFVFLYFASRGSGVLSLDRLIRGRQAA
jgi:putative oxidoreductase